MSNNSSVNSNLLQSLLNRSKNSEFLLKYDQENAKDLLGPRLPEDWE